MKKSLLTLILLLSIALSAVAQHSYNIVSSKQGKDGAYSVKVTTKVKDPKSGEATLKECAVRGVLFKGFQGEKRDDPAQKALITDAQVERDNAAFFSAFFSRGDYNKYVSMVNLSYKSIKISKKEYEVSALFLVDKESLLKHLEAEGIVKGFSNLW